MVITLTLIGIVFLAFCSFLWHRYTFWKRKKVPFIRMKFPFIFGNISNKKHLALQLADFYHHHREHPIIGIHTLLKPALLIVDLELIRHILTGKFEYFQNRGMFYNQKIDPLSAILGTLDHDIWKPIRQKLTPAFTPAKIKKMFSAIKIIGEALKKGLNEMITVDNQVEIRELFGRFATDIISATAIGIESTELQNIAKKAMKSRIKFPWNILTVAYPDFARSLGIRKHAKEVSDAFLNIVEQTIEMRSKNSEKRSDFMQLLIDSDLTVEQIAAFAFDLLSAGYADSTSTLGYCLHELSLPENQHIQNRAREEIRTVLHENKGELTHEAMDSMNYCKNIIKETLRKHPVAGNITRIATKPFKVPNTDYTIPKGMRVYIPVFAIHHDEEYYPRPEEFIPERFSDGNLCDKPGFLPFGDGPRKCIGFRFALEMISTGLVLLLKDFEFSTCDKTQIPMKYSSTKNTLIPSDGVWLNVKRINNNIELSD